MSKIIFFFHTQKKENKEKEENKEKPYKIAAAIKINIWISNAKTQ